LGNPLKSEGAAFRWLLAVLAGVSLVILVAVLMSSVAAALLGFILIAVVAVFIVRGMAHMLGAPDDDDPPAGESGADAGEPPAGSGDHRSRAPD
jgi:hypothetical protein